MPVSIHVVQAIAVFAASAPSQLGKQKSANKDRGTKVQGRKGNELTQYRAKQKMIRPQKTGTNTPTMVDMLIPPELLSVLEAAAAAETEAVAVVGGEALLGDDKPVLILVVLALSLGAGWTGAAVTAASSANASAGESTRRVCRRDVVVVMVMVVDVDVDMSPAAVQCAADVQE